MDLYQNRQPPDECEENQLIHLDVFPNGSHSQMLQFMFSVCFDILQPVLFKKVVRRARGAQGTGRGAPNECLTI